MEEVQQLSFAFALRTVELYKCLQEREIPADIISGIFNSGTAIGALIAQAVDAHGVVQCEYLEKALAQVSVALYWLPILRDSNMLRAHEADDMANALKAIQSRLRKLVK